jgi:transposase
LVFLLSWQKGVKAMAQQRLSMRQIKEVLRLRLEVGLSLELVAQSVGVSRSTVQECLRRAREACLTWSECFNLDQVKLHQLLYKKRPAMTGAPLSAVPDYVVVDQELRRKGMTRLLLWQEFKTAHPEAMQYTAFCMGYRKWQSQSKRVFRQTYTPGDRLFVDYAGQTVPIVDRYTGNVEQVQIFIAVLGASNYTFVEATLSQQMPDWLGSHVRCFKFMGGAPRVVVPDNLKSGVTKPHRYEPQINIAYAEMAAVYGIAVIPARVRKPRDKAKVEAGVLLVSRWILACLRKQTYFSLGELNQDIARLRDALNQRPFQKMPGSRASLFKEVEQAALLPLPANHYEYGRWKPAKVHPDYHVQIDKAFYSVPYALVGKTLDARIGQDRIELFDQGKLVTSHHRSKKLGSFTTLAAHLAPEHTAMIDQSIDKVHARALRIGPSTLEIVQRQARSRKHPEQTLRSSQGIVRLAQDYSNAQLEQACAQALSFGSYSYKVVSRLIKTPPVKPAQSSDSIEHENLRGPQYFH